MSTAGSPVDATTETEDATGLRVAIIVARFNADVTDRLLAGAQECFSAHGSVPGDLDVFGVPGAWELPQVAARIVDEGDHDAVVALGCVIRGETPHFDYVCRAASAGLNAVAREAKNPVDFGVLTTDDHAQAMARAQEGRDNKGYEAAMAALQMARVLQSLEGR